MLFLIVGIANINQSISWKNMGNTSKANNKPDVELDVGRLNKPDNNEDTEHNT